jgi:hypothetical protein
MHESSCPNFRMNSLHNRRELLRLGGASLLGLSLPQLLAAQTQTPMAVPQQVSGGSFGRAKACILLFMWGGPAQQDTWDMKPDAPVEFRGEFNPIQTVIPGVQICEHFPRLADRVDQLSIIRSMTHENVNHTAATHYLLTGEKPPLTTEKHKQWPHIGSVLSKLRPSNNALPPFVSMRPKLENTVPRFVEESQGQFAGWMGSKYDPMTIDQDPHRDDYRIEGLALQPELSVERLRDRQKLVEYFDRKISGNLDAFDALSNNQQRALELIAAATDQRGAFDLHEEPTDVRERYGMNPHGQSVLQARRLVERGVPLVTVFWPNDGIKNVSVYWDTHSRNFIDLKERLMPVADQAFSALLDDLRERGMLDDTLVVWTGEFGRTPKVGQRNSDAGAGRDGRDHWPGVFTSVLAGGGSKAGLVYGASDAHAAYPASNAVTPRDFVATVYHLLGIPENQIVEDTQGRPNFVRPGQAIHDLMV